MYHKKVQSLRLIYSKLVLNTKWTDNYTKNKSLNKIWLNKIFYLRRIVGAYEIKFLQHQRIIPTIF